MKTLIAFAPLLALFGCAHPQTKAEPVATNAPMTAAATAKGTCGSDSDCGNGQLCIRNRCEEISAGLAECDAMRVDFALNSDELTEADRNSLARGARCIKGDRALHVTILGNADERGTEEYNLALGDRRANKVAKYLEALGASQSQLKTVSYGKENPLCTEHDEACWAKNRRADFKLTNGKK